MSDGTGLAWALLGLDGYGVLEVGRLAPVCFVCGQGAAASAGDAVQPLLALAQGGWECCCVSGVGGAGAPNVGGGITTWAWFDQAVVVSSVPQETGGRLG